MFGLSLVEVSIFLIVVIVFINPKDYPSVARSVGKLIGQFKQVYDSFITGVQDFSEPGAKRDDLLFKSRFNVDTPPPSSKPVAEKGDKTSGGKEI